MHSLADAHTEDLPITQKLSTSICAWVNTNVSRKQHVGCASIQTIFCIWALPPQQKKHCTFAVARGSFRVWKRGFQNVLPCKSRGGCISFEEEQPHEHELCTRRNDILLPLAMAISNTTATTHPLDKLPHLKALLPQTAQLHASYGTQRFPAPRPFVYSWHKADNNRIASTANFPTGLGRRWFLFCKRSVSFLSITKHRERS